VGVGAEKLLDKWSPDWQFQRLRDGYWPWKIKTPNSARITPQSLSWRSEKNGAIVPLRDTTHSFQYLPRISWPPCPFVLNVNCVCCRCRLTLDTGDRAETDWPPLIGLLLDRWSPSQANGMQRAHGGANECFQWLSTGGETDGIAGWDRRAASLTSTELPLTSTLSNILRPSSESCARNTHMVISLMSRPPHPPTPCATSSGLLDQLTWKGEIHTHNERALGGGLSFQIPPCTRRGTSPESGHVPRLQASHVTGCQRICWSLFCLPGCCAQGFGSSGGGGGHMHYLPLASRSQHRSTYQNGRWWMERLSCLRLKPFDTVIQYYPFKLL